MAQNMAQNIVAELFGLSPNQVQQQQQANINQQAWQYANADPFARATAGMYQGGAGLADLGAGMLGMVNPQVQEAKRREATLSQIDYQTPEGILKGAELARQRGDYQTQIRLQAYADQKQNEEVDLALKKAHAKYYEQSRTGGGQSQLSAKQAIAYNNALKYYLDLDYPPDQAREMAMQEAKKVAEFFGQQGMQQNQGAVQPSLVPGIGQTNIQPATLQGQMTTEDLQTIRQDALKNGDTATVQSVDAMLKGKTTLPQMTKSQATQAIAEAKARGEKVPAILSAAAAATEGGKTGIEIYTKQYHAADAADKVVQQTDDLLNQLRTGDVNTGISADLRTGISRMQALLGGKDAAKNATDTQIADVMMGSQVFPLIQSLGIGARGMDTPAEREYMRKMLTGELGLEKGTLIKMAEIRKEAAQKDIEKWNKNVDEGNLDAYFKNVGIPKRKFGEQKEKKQEESLPAMPPPSQHAGRIIKDTNTGIRYKSDGSKWVRQ